MTDGRHIIVSVVGEMATIRFRDCKLVDASPIEQMGDELFQLVDEKKFKFITLDFTGVEFLGSSALNKLIVLDRKVKAQRGRVRIVSLRPEIAEVFKITKLLGRE